MAGMGVLARRYVEFASKGVAGVSNDAKKVRDQLKAQIRETQQLAEATKRLKASREQARIVALAERGLMTKGERFNEFAGKAGMALGALTATTMGWVTAGMSGTVQAYQLQQQFGFLSREIAGIFKPTIESVIQAIRDATQWFRNLSAEQQGQIRKFVLWTAGVLGGIVALNMLRKALLTARVMALAFQASLGPVGWAMIALGVVLAQNESRWHVLERVINAIADAFGPLLDNLESTMNVLDKITQFKMPNMKDIAGGGGSGGIGKMFMKNNPAMLGSDWLSKQLTGKSITDRLFGEDKKSKKDGSDRNQMDLDKTGFESIGSAWDRMANEVLRQDPMKKASEDIGAILKWLERMEQGGLPGKKKPFLFS